MRKLLIAASDYRSGEFYGWRDLGLPRNAYLVVTGHHQLRGRRGYVYVIARGPRLLDNQLLDELIYQKGIGRIVAATAEDIDAIRAEAIRDLNESARADAADG